jgi:hypothetical protein
VAGFVGADAFDDVQLFEFLDVAPDGGAVFFQGLCQSVIGYIRLLLYILEDSLLPKLLFRAA